MLEWKTLPIDHFLFIWEKQCEKAYVKDETSLFDNAQFLFQSVESHILGPILQPLTSIQYIVNSSFSFVKEITNTSFSNGTVTVSYDVF